MDDADGHGLERLNDLRKGSAKACQILCDLSASARDKKSPLHRRGFRGGLSTAGAVRKMVTCKLWICHKMLLLCFLQKAGFDPPPAPPRRGVLQTGLEINGLNSTCLYRLDILLVAPLLAMTAGTEYQDFHLCLVHWHFFKSKSSAFNPRSSVAKKNYQPPYYKMTVAAVNRFTKQRKFFAVSALLREAKSKANTDETDDADGHGFDKLKDISNGSLETHKILCELRASAREYLKPRTRRKT